MNSPKRQSIIDAATQVFLAKGYAGSTMKQIAAAACASKQTLYNQFADKDDLFHAAVNHLWATLDVPVVVVGSSAPGDARRVLTRLGLAMASFWERSTVVAFLRMIITEGTRFPDLQQRFFGGAKARTVKAVASVLEQLDGHGLSHIGDPAQAALQWLGLINEPLLWARVMDAGHTPDAAQQALVVHRAVDMFVARYGERQPPGI